MDQVCSTKTFNDQRRMHYKRTPKESTESKHSWGWHYQTACKVKKCRHTRSLEELILYFYQEKTL